MSDIGPGDVVVCVNDQPLDLGPTPPNVRRFSLPPEIRVGRMFRVESVHVEPSSGIIGIRLIGVSHRPRSCGCSERRFRKIYPADPAFIERIKRLKVDA